MAHHAPLEGVPPLPADVRTELYELVFHNSDETVLVNKIAKLLSTARKQGADAERERILNIVKSYPTHQDDTTVLYAIINDLEAKQPTETITGERSTEVSG